MKMIMFIYGVTARVSRLNQHDGLPVFVVLCCRVIVGDCPQQNNNNTSQLTKHHQRLLWSFINPNSTANWRRTIALEDDPTTGTQILHSTTVPEHCLHCHRTVLRGLSTNHIIPDRLAQYEDKSNTINQRNEDVSLFNCLPDRVTCGRW